MIFIWVLLSIIAVIVLTSKYKLNSFIALLIASLFLGIVCLAPSEIADTLKEGFGLTLSSIGLIIIFGTLIGVNLQKSGAAQKIAGFILAKTGNKRAKTAIAITGFLTGIPIFCDSGFIILNGISQSFAKQAKVSIPVVASILGVSLYSVHCLIPPHPGATAAAGIMGANIGSLMVFGLMIAIPVCIIAFFYISFLGRHSKPDMITAQESFDPTTSEINLPDIFLSFLPIIIPLLLISLKSFFSLFTGIDDLRLTKIIFFIGDPVFALLTGACFSLLLIHKRTRIHFNELFEEAINKAGPILIITAAGGMFGAVIKATGAGETAGKILAVSGLGLFIPFLIAGVLKTAQGSSTVAIITAASLVSPMLSNLGLDSENGRLLATLSMGAGSMLISHANDSYFWVITKFSGIKPEQTLKYYSSATIIMGMSSIAIIYCLQFVML
jgi:gluconate:H+ symporter, GntP family